MTESRRTQAKIRAQNSANNVLTESSPFAVNEAYKTIRTNLTFSLPGNNPKIIGVTSANRSEGKSLTSVNIGISLAQIDKTVLIIDCDMRLPSVANKLNIKGRPGLSDYLTGNMAFNECVRAVTEHGISVLPAGSIPPDPTFLLESEYMGKMLEKLKEYYDYIILDLPPVNTVSDAAIVAKYADGFLLVVRHNETQFRQISEMLRRMEFAEAKVLGFIYNDAPVSNKGNYYYYGKK